MCREDIFVPNGLEDNAVQVTLVCSRNSFSDNDVKGIKPCTHLPALQRFGLNSESNQDIAASPHESSHIANESYLRFRTLS